MRPALLAAALVLVAVLPPVALSGGTLYATHDEVNVGQHFRQLVTRNADGGSQITIDLRCWENVVARVVVVSMAPDVGVAECTSFRSSFTFLAGAAGPVRILVMAEGTGDPQELGPFVPGFFEVEVAEQL